MAATPVEELIRQSEVIFSRLASAGGPFEHWRVVRAGLAARDGAMASEGARNIFYYMQNQAMRLMISRGYGLQPAPDVRPARGCRGPQA